MPSDLMYKSFEDVADYLCKVASTDMQKLRALFTWLTSVNVSHLQKTLLEVPEPRTPLDCLLKIHWEMSNHAHVFKLLCT